MLTMLYMLLDGVVGMEICLVGYAVCVAAYFLVCFLLRPNRAGKRRIVVALGWLISELLCDVIWYLIFYQNGDYVNFGIGGAAAMLLLPGTLFLSAVITTAVNAEKS